MAIPVYCMNAFSKMNDGGNPAGVVLNASGLSEADMQEIAKRIGFAETAFAQPSEVADFKIQFFTPEGEVDLCGHATIATFSLMHQTGLLKPGHYKQETLAGILDLEIHSDGTVFMAQNPPQFYEILAPEALMNCLQIPQAYLNEKLPIQIVSTGLRDILVPINTLKQLNNIQPDLEKVTAISKAYDVVSVHLFTLETLHGSTAHCRNLAPLYGIPEESATGTSNGALSCYLQQYQLLNNAHALLCYEQGYSMQRPSEILARLQISHNQINEIWVGGIATQAGHQILQMPLN